MNKEKEYFWIRTFDYQLLRDKEDKGILLDEFYTNDKNKEEVKEYIKNERYIGNTSKNILFKKPKDKDGFYCLILKSNFFFYDRFYKTIDTICFCCHKHIVGKAMSFPHTVFENSKDNIPEGISSNGLEDIYFCSSDCKEKYLNDVNPFNEGEFQEKESEWNNIYGYIYCIYNRNENKYYIGQTRFLPFFRWQEHVKSRLKGNIEDLEFKVITTVKNGNEIDCQKRLDNIETWWINKYLEDGYDTFNISKTHQTKFEYKNEYDEMIKKYKQTGFSF